jgi:hypothetical protein
MRKMDQVLGVLLSLVSRLSLPSPHERGEPR